MSIKPKIEMGQNRKEMSILEKIFDAQDPIYRDMLEFCRLNPDSEKSNSNQTKLLDFGLTDIGRWLMDHHRAFYDPSSSIPKSYRLHSKHTLIKSRVDDLVDKGIFEYRGTTKSRKNNLDTPVYRPTMTAIYYGWFLHVLSNLEKESNNKMARTQVQASIDVLFTILKQRLGRNNSSIVQFLQKFLGACQDRQLFVQLVKTRSRFFLEELDSSFTLLLRVLSANRSKYPALFDLFLETLKGLDKDVQKLLFLIIKIDIEYGYIADYTTIEWERKRYQNIHDESTVTLQCRCMKCESLYPTSLDILEFLLLPNIFKYSNDKPVIQNLDCVKCGQKNCSAIVPFWIDITIGKNRNFIVPIKPIANS